MEMDAKSLPESKNMVRIERNIRNLGGPALAPEEDR
jgi:hypothetical protein